MNATRTVIVLDGSQRCSNPKRHAPRPWLLAHHHVVPESWVGGGPTVVVCSTCHMNIHVLIDEYVAAGAQPPGSVLRRFDGFTRELAAKAWASRPPNPTRTL